MRYHFNLSQTSNLRFINNGTKYSVRNQALVFDVVPISEVIINSPEFFSKLSQSYLNVISVIAVFSRSYKHVACSQSYIAFRCKITRQYVNKILKDLKEWGIINSTYRHMNTCIYKLSSYFDNPHVRSSLAHLIAGFMPLASLLSPSGIPLKFRKLTQYIYNEVIKKKVNNKCRLPVGWIRYKNWWWGNKNENFLQRCGEKMYGAENPISMAIRDIKEFNLARRGQVKLSVFPDHIIQEARKKYAEFKNIRDPFAAFYKICIDECDYLNIKPDWENYYRLVNLYHIRPDAPLLLEKPMSDNQYYVTDRNKSQEKNISHIQIVNQSKEKVKKEPEKGRSAAYKLWEYKERVIENPEQELKIIEESLNRPDVAAFCKMVGDGYFKRLCQNITK